MNSLKKYAPLTFAVIFAVLASASVYAFLKDRSNVVHASPAAMTPVVIAKHAIPIGTKLAEHDLSAVSWPQEAVPESSFRSVRPLIGRTARTSVETDEPILDSKLLAEGESFASLIPQGMRAVTVRVKQSAGLSRILERGTVVDVLSLFYNVQSQLVTAEVIVEKARVISIHDQTVAITKKGLTDNQADYMEATLVVTPEQAQWILAAANQGGIELTVRNDQ
ncbi:MAG: Flp pilus assembly protein CpaB [Candidatus Omnitrophica bacterium]|nr:Flp pilus assembly protein CpaB [Candidatus Omnitrophota bacterium]